MENVFENNKLIADFMGIPFDGKYYLAVTTHLKLDERNYSRTVQDLNFRTSWNWIMPVVEKIESLIFDDDNYYEVNIYGGNIVIIIDTYGNELAYVDNGKSKLESLYLAVVEFIKWYNKN